MKYFFRSFYILLISSISLSLHADMIDETSCYNFEIARSICNLTAKSSERNYFQGYSKDNFNDIAFIVKTLSYKSLTQLWKYKGSLENAGSRVQLVHPLNFLLCIFENEELKVGIRNIRKRGWVWSDFFNGLKTSLKEEFVKENLTEEMVLDFTNKLQIDATLMIPLIQNQEWSEFVDKLIEIVPRKGNTDLYGF